jgi:PAS domain S-box-containing protein
MTASRPSALEQFGAFADSLPDAVVVVDETGRIASANKQTELLFGHAREDLLDRAIDILIPSDFPRIRDQIRAGDAADGRMRPMRRQRILRGLRKDGSTFSAEISLSHLTADGRVFVCSVIRDVSWRTAVEEQLRTSEERFRILVDHAADGIFIADAQGRYVDVNPAGCEMLGYSRDEILRMSMPDVLAPDEVPRLNSELGRLLGGSPARSEWRFRRKDGSILYGEVHGRQLPDSRFLGYVRDISQHRQVEDELRASQKFIEAVTTASPPVIYVFDLDEKRLLYSNRPLLAGLGYPKSVSSIDRFDDFKAFMPSEEGAHLDRLLVEWRVLRDGQVRDDEYRLIDAGGDVHWYLGREIAFTRGQDGSVRQILGTFQDITGRKRADQSLANSRALLQSFVEHTPAAVAMLDRDMRYIAVSRRWMQDYELGDRDLVGKHHYDVFPEIRTMSYWPEVHARCMAGAVERREEDPFVRADGHTDWLRWEVRPWRDEHGAIGGIIMYTEVITDRKHTKELLRQSEERYRLIVENQTEFIVKWLPDGTRTFVNESYCRTFGLREQDCVGTSFFPLVSPEFRQAIAAKTAALTPAEPEYTEEHLSIVPGGHRWQQWTSRGIFDAEGQLVEILSTGRDITERKEAEEKLRQSQRHLIASQRIARVGSWEMDLVSLDDLSGNPVRWSDECFRVFGYSPGEVEASGPAHARRVHPDDRRKVRDAATLALTNRTAYVIDYRLVGADGTERIVHEQAELVLDPVTRTPVRFIGTAQDITDRVRLEEQLRQSQKMQAIGQLAGGVAHDFNNLLTIINGHAEMLLDTKGSESQDRVELNAIRDAGERAALLTRQLLLFSRKAMLEPRVLDCNTLVQRTSQMLRRLISEDVVLSTVLAPSLHRIKADASQIEQILLNLSLNACDAMPRGGRLTIETRNVSYDDEDRRVHPEYSVGPFVQLVIADTGTGMTPHVKAHLFEPFFTTKGPGKGTGLGLATVYGIVQESGGFITVSSEANAGTTFYVSLPALEGDDVLRAPDAIVRDRLGGCETILLVEDDAGVRQIAKLALTKYGYRVLEASNGANALEVSAAYPETIHALVSDIVMPEMNGRVLADAVRARRPRCCVLLMSGYNEDMLVRAGVHAGAEAFIQKPFTPEALITKLRQVLDQVPGAGLGATGLP